MVSMGNTLAGDMVYVADQIGEVSPTMSRLVADARRLALESPWRAEDAFATREPELPATLHRYVSPYRLASESQQAAQARTVIGLNGAPVEVPRNGRLPAGFTLWPPRAAAGWPYVEEDVVTRSRQDSDARGMEAVEQEAWQIHTDPRLGANAEEEAMGHRANRR